MYKIMSSRLRCISEEKASDLQQSFEDISPVQFSSFCFVLVPLSCSVRC